VRPGIDQLTAAGIKRDVAERWLPHVQQALDRFGIASERQVAAWLAQTAHESGGYTMLVENLNYRASTMAACWPARFGVKNADGTWAKDDKGARVPNKFALALERKPEPLANVVYSSRMGNGPVESGDGWKYRGRGLKQLTGKDNYTRCGQALGLDLVSIPDLLTEPEGAALSAAWFWSVNKCGPLADADDFVGLTKKINGGTIGLADRQKRYQAVLTSLGY
jgi:putative chitinase